jgi:hypothetical protein
MKSIFELAENDAIHCPTKEEAMELCNLFHKLGIEWSSGEPFHKNDNWETYKENTYYYPRIGCYDRGLWATMQKTRVYKASDFTTPSIINQFLNS